MPPHQQTHIGIFDDHSEYNGFQGYGNHTQNNPMHALAEAMANLDRTLGGGRQGHGNGMCISRGPGFPFGQCGHNHVPDISGLHISGFEEAFSHPIFAGHRVATQPSYTLSNSVPVSRPSHGRLPLQHPIGHTSHQGFGPGDYLPLDVHPNQPPEDIYGLGSIPYGYFPIEFDPVPLEEDMGPTESSEQRVNRFIAHHTEPLSSTNTTSTTNTDCPICMENADAHPCVKIKGIAGCEHMIGRDCLKELLSRQADDEKTCPLCRATWLGENGLWQDSEQWRRRTGRRGQGVSSSRRDRMVGGTERLAGLLRSAEGQRRRRYD
ncbi:uncharacterized protein ALTATR162_LOCUS5589 [Alternaria atra]|uniref:RING-type domain-containing protein n=1 Tax=Alternaria atra TaxID=119953 RepID=A0A8J2I821_9PLEO|nr:uncharacterized protein ALTATR162_LOCUS5589 [Alternaria atra]CAG5159450.1 unnamed protein product [Alternaria atra]